MFSGLIDRFWLYDTLVTTAAPPIMAGRIVVSARRVSGGADRLLVVSQRIAGNQMFHHVDVDPSRGVTWASSFEDAAYPSAAGGRDPLLAFSPVRLMVPAARNRVRVYVGGDSSPQFAGEIPAPAGEQVVAAGVVQFSAQVLTTAGKWLSHACTVAPNGTASISSTGQTTLFAATSGLKLTGACVFDPSLLLYSTLGPASHDLMFYALGAIYPQASDPNLEMFLGEPYYFVNWYGSSGYVAYLIITKVKRDAADAGGLKVYYFPGTGGNGSWKMLRYTPPAGPAANRYNFPDPGPVEWDAWSAVGDYSYTGGAPIWIVTTDGATVRRLKLVPDLVNLTFTVKERWKASRAAGVVAWHRNTVGPLRHIEFVADGTTTIVTPGLLQRLVDR
jgi:hypothetical protein